METKRLIQATCPDCRGPLTEVVEEGVVEYRCLVEHRFSPISLLAAHSETQERALWAAALALEEAEVIAREVATHFPESSAELLEQGARKKEQAATIRAVLQELVPFTVDGIIEPETGRPAKHST